MCLFCYPIGLNCTLTARNHCTICYRNEKTKKNVVISSISVCKILNGGILFIFSVDQHMVYVICSILDLHQQ